MQGPIHGQTVERLQYDEGRLGYLKSEKFHGLALHFNLLCKI